MLTEKAVAICILEILRKYSDENHILTRSEIEAKLRLEYDLVVRDRRTIYGAIGVLTDPAVGYDISGYDDNGIGYYLLRDPKTDLEPSEVRMLCDAVCAFPFMDISTTKKMITKLQSNLSIHEQKQIRNLTLIKEDRKALNRQVFSNIDLLDEAISKKVKVKFDYCQYGSDKELHKRREKKYTVNPYGLVYCNEHYYLICSYCYQENVSNYRVDLMENVEITEYELDDFGSELSVSDVVRQEVGGFIGKPKKITMRVDKQEIGRVIDRFGTDIRITDEDENNYLVSLTASETGFVFWALQFIGYVEVLKPVGLREEIIRRIKTNRYGV